MASATSTLYFTRMKNTLVFVLLIFMIRTLWSQGENNIWYLGHGLGLDHNFTPPKVLTNGKLPNFNEGVSTYSDRTGQLLFYSNGVNIWNRNHEIMPNGSDLGGDRSSTQSVLFVQMPAQPGLIYVFTVSSGDINVTKKHIFQYSILDLNLDNGLGDILPGQKVIPLGTGYSEKLLGIKGTCGSAWVLLHKIGTQEIHAFRVSNMGIEGPVISEVLQSTILQDTLLPNFRGAMKASPRGDQISFCVSDKHSILEVFSFDNGTGICYDGKLIEDVSDYVRDSNYGFDLNYYNSCFSPDGSLLYTIEQDQRNRQKYFLVQYDLSSGIEDSIKQSKLIFSKSVNRNFI